jgi:hypothetical protein
MARDGDLVGARRQARNADLGSFEAYLVSAALAVGDTALTTVGLRWDLAEAADERDVDDPDEAVRALRERLESVVGPTEVGVLRSFFEIHSLSRW